MKTFRIDRKKWIRGKAAFKTKLWSEKNQAGCCLGHVIHQTTKCSWNDLDGLDEPNKFYKKPSLLTSYRKGLWEFDDIYLDNNTLAQSAMNINDDVIIPDAVREEQLIELFNKFGYELEFYN